MNLREVGKKEMVSLWNAEAWDDLPRALHNLFSDVSVKNCYVEISLQK